MTDDIRLAIDAARKFADDLLLRGVWSRDLANFIRTIDGDNTMGAGELAERIIDHLHSMGLLKGVESA